MRAKITTYGGEILEGTDSQNVQHWQLSVDGFHLIDVASWWHVQRLQPIADAINRDGGHPCEPAPPIITKDEARSRLRARRESDERAAYQRLRAKYESAGSSKKAE